MKTHAEGVMKVPVDKANLVSELSNYNLPYFVLAKVAKECNSELIKKGKIATVLNTMNESAITLLHKIFVQCEDDKEGEFSDYRFAVFMSSKFGAGITFDQTLKGKSGVDYMVKIACYSSQGLIAIGENKRKGQKASLSELAQFNEMVIDLSASSNGQQLLHAFYGSSVGYEKDFEKVFQGNKKTKAFVNKYGYSIQKTITLLEFKNGNTNKVLTAPF